MKNPAENQNPLFVDPTLKEVPNQKEGSIFDDGENEEPQKKGGIASKIVIGVLALLTGGVGFYAYSLYEEKQKTEAELNEQKEQIIKELDGLKVSYDKAVQDNKSMSEDLLEARNKVASYIDSLKTMKVSIASLNKYRNQVLTLKKEREKLLAINDSLRRSNAQIRQQRDSITEALQNATSYVDSLIQQNTKLREVVESGEDLQISKLTTEAVKVRSSGKLVETARARAADKIKICFTVVANKIAPSGSKNFYIQLIAPNGITLGKNDTHSTEKTTVNYSVVTKFIYENKNIDVCDFVSSTGSDFEKGKYKVVIFDDKLNTVGETEFVLK